MPCVQGYTNGIEIETPVPDARVFLDGSFKGYTALNRFSNRYSLVIRDLEVGDYQLTCTHAGYADYSAKLSVDETGITFHAVNFVKLKASASPQPNSETARNKTGRLEVISIPTRASVLLDGILVGITDLDVSSVTVGEHTVTVYFDYADTLNRHTIVFHMDPSEHILLSVDFESQTILSSADQVQASSGDPPIPLQRLDPAPTQYAYLNIFGDEHVDGVQVIINGKEIGKTPIRQLLVTESSIEITSDALTETFQLSTAKTYDLIILQKLKEPASAKEVAGYRPEPAAPRLLDEYTVIEKPNPVGILALTGGTIAGAALGGALLDVEEDSNTSGGFIGGIMGLITTTFFLAGTEVSLLMDEKIPIPEAPGKNDELLKAYELEMQTYEASKTALLNEEIDRIRALNQERGRILIKVHPINN